MADFSYLDWSFDGESVTRVYVKDAIARNGMCEYIKGTQTGSTNTWTGYSEDTKLRDGKQILYYLPFSSPSLPTLNITFSSGSSTGPKDILKNGVEAVQETFPASSVIRLTWVEANNAWALDTTVRDSVISYNDLSEKPQIESVTLEGNKTLENLGLQSLSNSDIEAILKL